jgi:ribosomal protein L11 methyltransferase
MLIWRKRLSFQSLRRDVEALHAMCGDRLAIVESPKWKTVCLEAAATQRRDLVKIRARFGGRICELPRDWLTRAETRLAKPIRIGKRLVVVHSTAALREAAGSRLIIPAGAAFGTGAHVTTAMSLRFLERISRGIPPGWSMVDLGTGSGILALAAKKFGAGEVVALDNDAMAISTAKANARLNKTNDVCFRIADVRKLPAGGARFDVVTANLFSELLVAILPKLKRHRSLIVSGILREQERDVFAAMERNRIELVELRRRGKWIALRCHPEDERRAFS